MHTYNVLLHLKTSDGFVDFYFKIQFPFEEGFHEKNCMKNNIDEAETYCPSTDF